MINKWVIGGLGIIVCVALISGCVSAEEQHQGARLRHICHHSRERAGPVRDVVRYGE